MDLDRIRTATEQAVCVSMQSIQLPGIIDARAQSVAVTSPHLQQVATQLGRHGQGEIRLAAEIEFFLRFSNTDLLRSI